MKTTRLPYTATKRIKGRLVHYYRRGNVWRTLSGDPGTDEHAAREYWEHRTGRGRAKCATSFNALIESYRASARWSELAPRTQRDYERVLLFLKDKAGPDNYLLLERRHVIEIQQAQAQRARFANYICQVLSILGEHAIDIGWRKDNPARGMKKLRGGPGYRAWPPWAITAFRKEASGPVLTAFELCLGTGQRIADVLKMRWDQIEDDEISVKQGKTGTELWIPFTDHLRAYIATVPRGGLTIVSGGVGRPMSYRAIEHRLRAPREAAGAQAYSFHGLRYNATSELFEAGCTPQEVMAITGHRTLVMVEKYGRGASQRRLARQARGRG